MSQTKSRVQACELKRKIVKATKRKYAMLCLCLSVCLSIGLLEAPLPRLMARSRL